MFKWTCLVAATCFGVAVLYLLVDLQQDITRSLQSAQAAVVEANTAIRVVNTQLPDIVNAVKNGSETLSELATDVELIRSIVGIKKGEQDRGLRGLATYADEIQHVLAEQTQDRQAKILVEEFFGSDLKVSESAEEFLVGLNREMVAILILAKSKQEVLWRSCRSSLPRRKPYYIQFPDTEPVPLEQFVKAHHPASAELPEYTTP